MSVSKQSLLQRAATQRLAIPGGLLRVACCAMLCSASACSQQRNPAPPPPMQLQQQNGYSVSQLSAFKLPDKLSLFGERVPLENPEVRERAEREFYLNLQQPGQLLLNLKRSGRYFQQFSAILKEKGVPDDVKYLAMAESALYMARSGKDAVGIWQFIEGTARRYGLEVTEYIDERRHVEKSTRAAADYLVEAKQRFGNWTMAAAAYNMGIDGAQYNVDIQGSSNYYELYFNEETSRYILRIAILKELLENADKYGIRINSDEYYSAERSQKVKEYKAIENLASWAATHGMSYKELKLLNPWMLKNSLPKPKNGFYEILVKS